MNTIRHEAAKKKIWRCVEQNGGKASLHLLAQSCRLTRNETAHLLKRMGFRKVKERAHWTQTDVWAPPEGETYVSRREN